MVPGRTDFNPYSPLHDPWIVPTASSTFDFLADQSASTIAHPKRAGISPITVNVAKAGSCPNDGGGENTLRRVASHPCTGSDQLSSS